MNFIADRLKRIKPSMTVGINVKANALRAEGKDVLVPVNLMTISKTGTDKVYENYYLTNDDG